MLKKLQLITLGIALTFAASATAVYAHCGSCGSDAEHAKAESVGLVKAGGEKAMGDCGGCTGAKSEATSVVNVSAKGDCANCEGGTKCADCDKKASGDCGGCTGAKSETTSVINVSMAGEGGCPASAKSCGDGMKTAYSIGSQVNCFKADHAQSGEDKTLTGLAGSKATVLIFWNQNCPYVKEAENRIARFAKEYKSKGVNVIAIDSGVTNSKSDIAGYAKDRPFPVLVNSDSSIAAKFGAVRTPEVFVLDGNKTIVYHGAFDSGREREANTRKNYAKDAVEAVLAGGAPAVSETPAFGCGIKYQKGVKALPAKNVIADAK